MHDKVMLSWKCLNICLMTGSSELIPYLALIVHAALLIK